MTEYLVKMAWAVIAASYVLWMAWAFNAPEWAGALAVAVAVIVANSKDWK